MFRIFCKPSLIFFFKIKQNALHGPFSEGRVGMRIEDEIFGAQQLPKWLSIKTTNVFQRKAVDFQVRAVGGCKVIKTST